MKLHENKMQNLLPHNQTRVYDICKMIHDVIGLKVHMSTRIFFIKDRVFNHMT